MKGLHKRARAGEISDFTGISSPYEMPGYPDIILDTGRMPLESCVQATIDLMVTRGIFTKWQWVHFESAGLTGCTRNPGMSSFQGEGVTRRLFLQAPNVETGGAQRG